MPKTKDSNNSDDLLIERFRKENDLEVLGMLYNKYMHLVYGVCLKYLKNREESQDAVMQIFEVLIKEVPKHDINVFKNWLYGVSKNYCLMKLRKQTSEKVKQLAYAEDFFMENAPNVHLLDKEAPIDLTKALKFCIDKLKEVQKQSVALFYFEQKCYREIAEELQIEEKKVKSYIQNGKRNLKACIEEREEKQNG